MKATGIVRRVDDLGRVVIPKELRRTMGIAEGTPLEIFVEGDKIVLRKYVTGCVICGDGDADVDVDGKALCGKCVARIVSEHDHILQDISNGGTVVGD